MNFHYCMEWLLCTYFVFMSEKGISPSAVCVQGQVAWIQQLQFFIRIILIKVTPHETLFICIRLLELEMEVREDFPIMEKAPTYKGLLLVESAY